MEVRTPAGHSAPGGDKNARGIRARLQAAGKLAFRSAPDTRGDDSGGTGPIRGSSEDEGVGGVASSPTSASSPGQTQVSSTAGSPSPPPPRRSLPPSPATLSELGVSQTSFALGQSTPGDGVEVTRAAGRQPAHGPIRGTVREMAADDTRHLTPDGEEGWVINKPVRDEQQARAGNEGDQDAQGNGASRARAVRTDPRRAPPLESSRPGPDGAAPAQRGREEAVRSTIACAPTPGMGSMQKYSNAAVNVAPNAGSSKSGAGEATARHEPLGAELRESRQGDADKATAASSMWANLDGIDSDDSEDDFRNNVLLRPDLSLPRRQPSAAGDGGSYGRVLDVAPQRSGIPASTAEVHSLTVATDPRETSESRLRLTNDTSTRRGQAGADVKDCIDGFALTSSAAPGDSASAEGSTGGAEDPRAPAVSCGGVEPAVGVPVGGSSEGTGWAFSLFGSAGGAEEDPLLDDALDDD